MADLAYREDRLRAGARARVRSARLSHHRLTALLLLVGPGILVMLGENDGPSMLSYATTGATYGIGFFVPFIVVTFAMAYFVQEMTVRLGIATHRGHAELIFDRFGPFWGFFAMGDLVVGNLLTLITEFVAIRAGFGYFGISAPVAVGIGIWLAVFAMATRRYVTWERIAMALAVCNLVFVPAAFFAHPDPQAIASALGSWRPLPHGGFDFNVLTLLLADVGATVTPWMLFFQQSTVADKGLTVSDLSEGRIDTALGAIVAAIAAIATVVATAPLFIHHIDPNRLANPADFATALHPYLGVGSTLFAIGITEAGIVAAMTISASSSYAFAEVFRQGATLNAGFKEGRVFYITGFVSLVIAASVVLIPNAPLLAMTITVNVIATLLMAPALLLLLLLVNDREIIGPLANGRISNIIGGSIVVAITVIGVAYGLITVFAPGAH